MPIISSRGGCMTDRNAHAFSESASMATFRTIDGLSIRFVESDLRDADALLFSPWPESVFAYEAMWARLAATTHLVAVDLPGFGRSEQRGADDASRDGRLHGSRGRRISPAATAGGRARHWYLRFVVRCGGTPRPI